jgi:hypothetical protein
MNTLRIVSLVCGASGIKRLSGLLTLLLLWPAFASAICSPAQTCVVTSGTVVVGPLTLSPPFNFAGRDFSASGVFTDLTDHSQLPFDQVFEPVSFSASFAGDVVDDSLQFELSVNGVPWGIPPGGDASVRFFATLDILGSNLALSSPFRFEGDFTGAPEPFSPGLGCDVLNCVTLLFRGSGIVTYDVGPNFEVGPLTFTFAAVPEPATLSLFALGLVGVGFMRRRKKS